jgi:hypothetical protein
MAQLSSINAIISMDVNIDSKPDLVMGGNNFEFHPQFGRLDASFGIVLLNQGDGKFEWMNGARSGVVIPGEIRDIKEITGKDKRYVLVAQNDQVPILYEIKSQQTSSKN